MRQHRFLPALLLALSLAGCRHHKKVEGPVAPRPATEDQVTRIRETYQRIYPDSRVGVVTAVRPQDNLVKVSEVDPKDFRINDIVAFMNSNQDPLTTGVVIHLTPDGLHVRYDPPRAGRRAPENGDLAVRFR